MGDLLFLLVVIGASAGLGFLFGEARAQRRADREARARSRQPTRDDSNGNGRRS